MIGLKLFMGHEKIKLSFNNKKLLIFRKIPIFSRNSLEKKCLSISAFWATQEGSHKILLIMQNKPLHTIHIFFGRVQFSNKGLTILRHAQFLEIVLQFNPPPPQSNEIPRYLALGKLETYRKTLLRPQIVDLSKLL